VLFIIRWESQFTDPRWHHRVLEIPTLGREILVSLKALYGKNEFFNKAEEAEIFEAKNIVLRIVGVRYLSDHCVDTKSRVWNQNLWDQKQIHITFTGAHILSLYLTETCGVLTILVAFLSSWHEEAIQGTASVLLWSYTCHVLWSLHHDTNSCLSFISFQTTIMAVYK